MILGAIIAGGQSRRFGSDKAMAILAGRPMIEHVIAALSPWADDVVVCGRDYPGLTGLADRPAPGLGPLGGFAAALDHAAHRGFERVLTLPCDTPSIDLPVLSDLTATPAPAYLADCPVIGIWPAGLGEELVRFLAEDNPRSVRAWAIGIEARALPAPSPANVNHPTDLARLSD